MSFIAILIVKSYPRTIPFVGLMVTAAIREIHRGSFQRLNAFLESKFNTFWQTEFIKFCSKFRGCLVLNLRSRVNCNYYGYTKSLKYSSDTLWVTSTDKNTFCLINYKVFKGSFKYLITYLIAKAYVILIRVRYRFQC